VNTRNEPMTFRGRFCGPRDRARLSAQIRQIRAWALRVEWFTLREAKEDLERLCSPTIFPESSISAQIRNLKKPSAGRLRCELEKRRRTGARGAGRGIWEYRLRPLAPASLASQSHTETAAPFERIKWPATFDELEAAGYGYTGTGKECECGRKILWWITPTRKWMPLTAIEGLRLIPHGIACDRAKQSHANAARADPRPAQAALF
jgi:hypothetical protein